MERGDGISSSHLFVLLQALRLQKNGLDRAAYLTELHAICSQVHCLGRRGRHGTKKVGDGSDDRDPLFIDVMDERDDLVGYTLNYTNQTI